MKKVLLILSFTFSSIIIKAQNNINTDTFYFSGNIPKIADSKTKVLLSGISNKCDSTQEQYFDKNIESNRAFRTISTLQVFNKTAKTNIFTNADAVIVSYFCQNIDLVNEIEFYEFIFNNEKEASLLVEKLNFLYQKKGFKDYIGFKNWYYKRVKNRVYFVDSKEEKSTIKDVLENKIQLLG